MCVDFDPRTPEDAQTEQLQTRWGFLMTSSIGAPADAPSTPRPTRVRGSVRVARAAAAGAVILLALGLAGLVPAASAGPVPACVGGHLSARIASWQGAAGSRIADVRIVNTSFTPCVLRNYPRVRLVSASGAVMINGAAASTTAATHLLAPLGFLRTEVADSNYCGPAFVKPVTLVFILPGTLGRVVAMPVSATDTGGVPPAPARRAPPATSRCTPGTERGRGRSPTPSAADRGQRARPIAALAPAPAPIATSRAPR